MAQPLVADVPPGPRLACAVLPWLCLSRFVHVDALLNACGGWSGFAGDSCPRHFCWEFCCPLPTPALPFPLLLSLLRPSPSQTLLMLVTRSHFPLPPAILLPVNATTIKWPILQVQMVHDQIAKQQKSSMHLECHSQTSASRYMTATSTEYFADQILLCEQ